MTGPYSVECEHCKACMEWALEEGYCVGDDVSCASCGAEHYVTTCCYGAGGEQVVMGSHDEPRSKQ